MMYLSCLIKCIWWETVYKTKKRDMFTFSHLAAGKRRGLWQITTKCTHSQTYLRSKISINLLCVSLAFQNKSRALTLKYNKVKGTGVCVNDAAHLENEKRWGWKRDGCFDIEQKRVLIIHPSGVYWSYHLFWIFSFLKNPLMASMLHRGLTWTLPASLTKGCLISEKAAACKKIVQKVRRVNCYLKVMIFQKTCEHSLKKTNLSFKTKILFHSVSSKLCL